MKNIFENWNEFIIESHSKKHEEQLEDIVKELEKASEMHANQSKQLEKASQMHASQAERIQKILDETDNAELEEALSPEAKAEIERFMGRKVTSDEDIEKMRAKRKKERAMELPEGFYSNDKNSEFFTSSLETMKDIITDEVKRDMVAIDSLKKAGKSVDDVPEAVTAALTRDYSDLMKAMNKKGK